MMNKRYVTRGVGCFLGLALFSSVVFGGLPALVLVEPAVEWLAGVIIQNGARQAVMTVGVAVNDASWASWLGLSAKTATLLSLVGLGVSSDQTKYEIPLQPGVAVPVSPVALPGEGDWGSYYNPIPYTDLAVKVSVKVDTVCQVAPQNSDDGVRHFLAPKVYGSWAELIAACEAAVAHRVPAVVGDTVVHLAGPSYPYEPRRLFIADQEFYTDWVFWQVGDGASIQYTTGYVEPLVEGVKDSVKPFKRDATGFYPDDSDPDWTDAELASWTSGKTIQFRDAAGNSVVNVAATAAETLVTSATAANPKVHYRKVVLDADAVPKSVVEGYAETGTIDSVVEANTSTDPAVDPDPGTVVFPSDYARTGEAGAAADGIKTKLDVLHDDLTKTADAPADLIAPDASTFEDSFFKGAFADLLEWDLPTHTSTCPTAAINFDFFGQPFNVNMNAQCVILADPTVSNTAQTAFVVLWILVALFIVLGA